MSRQRRLFKLGVLAIGVLGAIETAPATAQQDLLTQAQVYRLINTVQVLPRNQSPRPARLSDVIVPLDAIRTATRSRAELLFNEGSLARVGANAIFRFVPGTRSFQLRNGTALIMSLPNRTGTKVETPGGQVLAQALPPSPSPSNSPTPTPTPLPSASPPPEFASLAMIIQADASAASSGITRVFALTNSNITVFDLQGNQVLLSGGQTVAIQNGVLGAVQDFDLRAFYQSSNLAVGLGPEQESALLQEPLAVQQTLNTVRRATLTALDTQTRWLEGLCTLNGRGGSSTLASNCITTNTDDPLHDFQDRREVTTPVRREPVQVQPVQVQPVQVQPEVPIVRDPLPENGNNQQNGNTDQSPSRTVLLIQGGNSQGQTSIK